MPRVTQRDKHGQPTAVEMDQVLSAEHRLAVQVDNIETEKPACRVRWVAVLCAPYTRSSIVRADSRTRHGRRTVAPASVTVSLLRGWTRLSGG
jgi:hypothetical protein